MESRFRALRAPWARVYLPEPDRDETGLPGVSGYRRSIEIGFAGPTESTPHNTDATRLADIQRNGDWATAAALTDAAGQGPDGHGMNGHEYIDACRDKVCAGYMRGYLLIEDGQAKGFVFLAPGGRFARLKNLLIHPAHRRRGLGGRAVGLLRQEAARLGADMLVTLAIAGSPSVPMYQAQGMQEVCRQSEWVRPLA